MCNGGAVRGWVARGRGWVARERGLAAVGRAREEDREDLVGARRDTDRARPWLVAGVPRDAIDVAVDLVSRDEVEADAVLQVVLDGVADRGGELRRAGVVRAPRCAETAPPHGSSAPRRPGCAPPGRFPRHRGP